MKKVKNSAEKRARVIRWFSRHPEVLPLKLLLAVYRSAREHTRNPNELVAVQSIEIAARLRPIIVARVEWLSGRTGSK